MSTVATIHPHAPSQDFMRRDLARSGLLPEDFPVPPRAMAPLEGIARYRIYFGSAADDYWQDRFDRNEGKYIGPTGVPTQLFWPQSIGVFANATMTASVEGAKKAMLFRLTTGVPAAGLHSCHGWSEHTPESEEGLDEQDKAPTQLRSQLKAALVSTKTHLVLLDGDWQENPQVGAALAGYAFELEQIGVNVHAIDLRGFGGYDDWLVKKYGTDRSRWPSKEEALRALLKLPRVNVAEVAASRQYMLGTQDRFNRGHTDFTDRGHATQLLRLIRPENVRYLTDRKIWALCQRGQWVLSDNQPLEEVNRLPFFYFRRAVELKDIAAELKDDKRAALLEQADAFFKQGSRASSVAARKNILTDVASRARQQATLADFDADPDLMAVAGGNVVDLRTGVVRAERQDDLILSRCAAGYNGAEPVGPGADRMRRFVEEITAAGHGRPDPAMAAWLQVRVGAALRGRCQLAALELWIGEGANGKSILADVLGRALGDYAVTLPAGVLLSQFDRRSAEAASPFLSRAVNKRVAFVSETKDTDHLDLPKVKLLTGVNDKIAMRDNYASGGEYRVSWTIVMLSNSLPNVPQSDEAIWDRLSIVPFPNRWRREGVDDASLPPADLELRDRWVQDRCAQAWILWWAIQGSIQYEKHELPTKPASVSKLNTEYRAEQDVLGKWLGMEYVLEDGARTESREAFHGFLNYTEAEMGRRAELKKNTFTRRLLQRFSSVTKMDSNGKTYYVGIRRVSERKF